jgi:hypothetical protein
MKAELFAIYDSRDSAAAFLDRLGDTIAKAVIFDKGKLSPDERTAFVWGFRYGIHQMHTLLSDASKLEDEEMIEKLTKIMDDAENVWDLPITAHISAMIPLGKSPDEKEH